LRAAAVPMQCPRVRNRETRIIPLEPANLSFRRSIYSGRLPRTLAAVTNL